MRFTKVGLTWLVLMSVSAAGGARAQSQASPEIKSLVAQYVAAFNAKNVARLHALYCPQSLACINTGNKDFYDERLRFQWRDAIPAQYTITARAVNESNMKALESIERFPVKPAQELQIDYQEGDDSGSEMLWLVRENGKLLVDSPCATEQTIKQYRDDAPARAKLNAENKALADAIKDPLRSQLIGLIRDHKRGEATKLYKETSGKDYRTAIFVIDLLAHGPKK